MIKKICTALLGLVSLGAAFLLAIDLYDYFTYVRPLRKEALEEFEETVQEDTKARAVDHE